MRRYEVVVLSLPLLLIGCVEHGSGALPENPDNPNTPDGPDVGQNELPVGVYGRVLSYFESAGPESQIVAGVNLSTNTDVNFTSTRSGRYQLDVEPGTFRTVAQASGYRETHQSAIEYVGPNPLEKTFYMVTDVSITDEATAVGLENIPGNGFAIAHLIDEETGQAIANATLANITLTDLNGNATGITVYGIGEDGYVDPVATTTVRNQDGNAAVALFNIPPGEYLLNYNGGEAEIRSSGSAAHVTDLYVP